MFVVVFHIQIQCRCCWTVITYSPNRFLFSSTTTFLQHLNISTVFPLRCFSPRQVPWPQVLSSGVGSRHAPAPAGRSEPGLWCRWLTGLGSLRSSWRTQSLRQKTHRAQTVADNSHHPQVWLLTEDEGNEHRWGVTPSYLQLRVTSTRFI